MISAMMMTAATPASTHGTALVRVCSWGSDSPVPGLAGPLPAGLGVLGAPEDGPGLVGVCVDGPEGLLASGEGVAVVAATLPCAWTVVAAAAGVAAFAAAVVDAIDPAKRAKAVVVMANLRSIGIS
jgi:hypothetical protein